MNPKKELLRVNPNLLSPKPSHRGFFKGSLKGFGGSPYAQVHQSRSGRPLARRWIRFGEIVPDPEGFYQGVLAGFR